MTGWHELRLRVRAFFKRRQLDRDLEEEIRFHLDMKASRNRDSGMSAQDAADAARRQFGSPVSWKERIRDMWSLGLIESTMQDLRYALRSLIKAPGFATAAILVLALGIGSTTSIFSVVNAVLLNGLPFQDADRLVVLWGNVQRQKVERRGNSYPDYIDWKAQASSFVGMAAYDNTWYTLTGVDEPERIPGETVSAGYFELLGVTPILGRTIRTDEDRLGQSPVALLSEGLWKRRFGSEASIIGKPVRLNNRAFTIIGILPADFRGLTDSAELWSPFTALADAEDLSSRGTRGFPAVAKLKPGVPVRQAQVEMDGISKRLEQAYPQTNDKRAVEVAPLTTEAVGELQAPLLILLGAVGFVLLIACANVANLLLARSEARRQEIGIRVALGAGRGRVFRQLLTESVLLSAVGSALGLAISIWAVQLLVKASPITLPSFVHPQPDWNVAAVAVALSLLVGISVGLLPASQVLKEDVQHALKDVRSGDSTSRQRFRGALVVTEVALAMILLAGAGLLMRSFQQLSALHPGFNPQRMLTLTAALQRSDAPDASATAAADARTVITGRMLLERIKALPSVTAAAIASDVPLSGGGNAMFYSAEGQSITDAQTRPRAYVHRVSPEFFATMQAQFVAGRSFTETELNGRSDVVVVTDNLTRRFWPGQDPAGKRIKAGGPQAKTPWLTIVGVVREMKYRGLPANPTADPDVFYPFSDRQRNIAILLRTANDPSSLVAAVRAAIHQVDPAVPIYGVAAMTDRVGTAIERSRFSSWMMAIFAGLSLLLSSIGLYGLMAYTVRRRTRELGVRMAIGASTGEIAGIVLRKGMTLVAIGMAAGLVVALALTRLLETLLFGVGATDPATFATVAIVLAATALLACYLPARRASRIDPVNALRYE